MTHDEILESFKSKVCPSCGGIKNPRQSLCGKCFYTLPGNKRRDLWLEWGKGYEEAFEVAMEHLKKPRTE